MASKKPFLQWYLLSIPLIKMASWATAVASVILSNTKAWTWNQQLYPLHFFHYISPFLQFAWNCLVRQTENSVCLQQILIRPFFTECSSTLFLHPQFFFFWGSVSFEMTLGWNTVCNHYSHQAAQEQAMCKQGLNKELIEKRQLKSIQNRSCHSTILS